MLLKIDMILKKGIYLSCYCFHFWVFLYRKKKVVHKTVTTDDKRLQSTLKRLGVNSIPGIEEVNIFKDDSVIHFTNPKGKQIPEDLIRNLPFCFHFSRFGFMLMLVFIPIFFDSINTSIWFNKHLNFCFLMKVLLCLFFHLSVQASIAANTWVFSGSPQTKSNLSSFIFLFGTFSFPFHHSLIYGHDYDNVVNWTSLWLSNN